MSLDKIILSEVVKIHSKIFKYPDELVVTEEFEKELVEKISKDPLYQKVLEDIIKEPLTKPPDKIERYLDMKVVVNDELVKKYNASSFVVRCEGKALSELGKKYFYIDKE